MHTPTHSEQHISLEDFLNASPVNFFAVETVRQHLEHAGFHEWDASKPCPQAQPGAKFYVRKNGSAIFAFHIGSEPMHQTGLRMISAHSDSPTFRVKPHAEILCEGGLVKLNTELYGGAIMSTWMDRPLSLAGRVVLHPAPGESPLRPRVQLLRIDRPILTIPNLAIHFNRQVNDGMALSKQKDMLPILTARPHIQCEPQGLLQSIVAEHLGVDTEDILDFDLYLYDTTPAQRVGLHEELVQSARLDDLSMVHAGMTALLASAHETPCATQCLAIFDNEETGSLTKQGAASPFFAHLVNRLVATQSQSPAQAQEEYYRCVENTFMVSADNAHAWHPNYTEKYDPTNRPLMGGGPVIKYNASQKYLSDAEGASVLRLLCQKAGVQYQTFVNHSDVAGGSTLGNILSQSFPVRGVDMGNPIWAMHSARETASIDDHMNCIRLFTQFFQTV